MTFQNIACSRAIQGSEQRGVNRLHIGLLGVCNGSLSQIHGYDLQYSHAVEATQQRSLRHAS